MTQQTPLVYDPVAQVHKPLAGGDQLLPNVIPLSARAGNQIQVLADGFYSGQAAAASTYYVSSVSGSDAPTSGAIGSPYKTLDYALAQLSTPDYLGFAVIANTVVLQLKAGETFVMNNSVILDGGKLNIGFYADPNYGAATSFVGQALAWAVGAPLQRPLVSNVGISENGYWNCSRFTLRNGAKLWFSGLAWTLPGAPISGLAASAYGMYTDVVSVDNYHHGQFNMLGTVFNKADINSFYGVAGAQARADDMTVGQFASQFLIAGVQVVSGATAQALTSRATFFKMYTDFAGNNQTATSLVPASLTSSAGTSVMRLNWSDVAVQNILTGVPNLGTYPYLADATYGLKWYFTGLIRDQQARPLNVLSGRLF